MLEAVRLGTKFYQVNHTWDHEHLDCYLPVPNSGICRGATYAESVMEIGLNQQDAAAINLPIERQSMVTPNISGLFNPNFMQAAREAGIRYVVGDTSRPEFVPPVPNHGIWNPYQVIMMIPRRANNLFYNVTTPNAGAGSWPQEFNYFYGPNGIFRIGGTGGPPFFTTEQTYQNILDFESDGLLRNMLKYEVYPVMFHQSNVYHYNGTTSLYEDLIKRTFDKYNALVRIPVLSYSEMETGGRLIDRMSFDASGAVGTWVPGVSVTVRVISRASVPITGVCSANCVTYSSDRQSRVVVPAGGTVVIPAP
jgi:hypothetical protein